MIDLLLDGVSAKTRRTLDDNVKRQHFAIGEDIIDRLAPPTRMHQLTRGRAKVWRPGADGNAVVLFFLHPGDTPGLISICRHKPNFAMVTAATPVETLSWPTPLILSLLHDDRRMAANALEVIARRVEVLADRVEDLTSIRADQQLARALLRLAGEDGRWKGGTEATVPVTRQDLADMTGTTLHTASRTLSGWQARNIVHSVRGQVTIDDPAGLAEIAGLAA